VKVAAADALSTAEKLAGEKAQPAKSSSAANPPTAQN